jgi:hypothetical protein
MSGEPLEVVTENKPAPAPEAEVAPAPEEPVVAKEEEAKEEEAKPETTEPEYKYEEDPKTHGGRRWNKLLQDLYAKQAKLDVYEKQQQPKTEAAPVTAAPSRESFADDESYVQALVQHQLQSQLEPLQRKILERQQALQTETVWDTKVAEAKKEYPDWDAVVGGAHEVPVTETMVQALKASPLGTDITYYLGSHPEEAERIAGLDQVSSILELGRISSYIEYEKSQKSKAAKVISKAPAPPRTPTGASTTKSEGKTLSEMSYDEYVKARMASKKKR